MPGERRGLAIAGLMRSQRGQALIEFMLIIPTIFVLAAAVWQYGLFFDAQLVATNAAREGARYGSAVYQNYSSSSNPTFTQVVQTRVNSYLLEGYGSRLNPPNTSGDLSVQSISVTCFNETTGAQDTANCPSPGERIVVTVSVNVRLILPIVPGLSNPATSSGSSSMHLN